MSPTVEAIREVEQRLKAGGIREVNRIPDLLDALNSDSSVVVLAAVHALRRTFDRLKNVCDSEVEDFVRDCRGDFYNRLAKFVEEN